MRRAAAVVRNHFNRDKMAAAAAVLVGFGMCPVVLRFHPKATPVEMQYQRLVPPLAVVVLVVLEEMLLVPRRVETVAQVFLTPSRMLQPHGPAAAAVVPVEVHRVWLVLAALAAAVLAATATQQQRQGAQTRVLAAAAVVGLVAMAETAETAAPAS